MKRVLVIRGGALGDFILTLPAITALRHAFPAAELSILGNKPFASLAREMLKINSVESLDDLDLARFFVRGSSLPKKWRSWFSWHDCVISYLHDPQKVFEGNVRACGVKNFIPGPSRIENDPHATEQLAAPLQKLGISEPDFAPVITIGETERAAARAKFGGEGQLTVLHPGSGSSRKNWPIKNWISLIAVLLGRNLRGVIIGGEADETEIALVRARFGNRLAYAINWPLPQLAALLADAIFLGHDSGVSHLAAAVGARCLILFGPTDPKIWAPRNRNARVLLAPAGDLNRLDLATVRAALKRGAMIPVAN